MTTINFDKPRGTVFSVLADGKFHTTVAEGTPNAVKRDWETKDGKKGSKWELTAQSIEGYIKAVGIYDGDYGDNLQIEIGDSEVDVTVFLSTGSQYGEDFMKKLPNLKKGEMVRLSPYSFKDEQSGKDKKGMTIYQSESKITDFYHEKKGEKIAATNGYPEVPEEAKKWKSEDWKLFFLQARKFLKGEVQKSPFYSASMPNDKNTSMSTAITPENYPQNENDVDASGIPF